MEKNLIDKQRFVHDKNTICDILVLVLTVIGSLFVIWTFTGKWPWVSQPYNSYILQAEAWTKGQLDLGKDYPYLELAIYKGKYFVSFPPLPSFIMFPFVLLHWKTCDGFIAAISAVMAAIYAYKLIKSFGIDNNRSIMYSLLLTIGSNWLFTAQTAWVWFIAQNLAFTFSLMALYYARNGKGGLALAFWACAVGCRPLQIAYLPAILYMLYEYFKCEVPNSKLLDIIKLKWKCVIPMIIIALSYMVLNFARFGNPLEFGHNYLPEFTRSENGQFSAVYILQNIPKLFRLPDISFSEKWTYQNIDGFLIFIASPIFLTYAVYVIRSFIRDKDKNDNRLTVLIVISIILELFLTTAHKTMGGEQFGNRYTNDVLPLLFLGIASVIHEKKDWEKLNLVLLAMGFAVNILGSMMVFNK